MATIFNATALATGTSNLNNRADAINLSTDLVQAGVVFNDAVRISTGLFSTPQNSGNPNPFLTSYTTDLHAVQTDITTILAAAPQTTNAATLMAADQTIHTMQAQILQEINNDPHLANALQQVTFMATTGANDVAFQATPVGSDNA